MCRKWSVQRLAAQLRKLQLASPRWWVVPCQWSSHNVKHVEEPSCRSRCAIVLPDLELLCPEDSESSVHRGAFQRHLTFVSERPACNGSLCCAPLFCR